MVQLVIPMKRLGFTLPELLITLAIVALSAPFFLIPKVLPAQGTTEEIAKTKEVVAIISGAYEQYKLQHKVSSAFALDMLTPYMNYVSIDTSPFRDMAYVSRDTATPIDSIYSTAGIVTCGSNAVKCLRANNGAILAYDSTTFDGSAPTNAIYFTVDPDGKVTQAGSPAQGEGKKVLLWLYYSGHITSNSTCLPGTHSKNLTPICPGSPDPPWFGW